MLRAAQCLPSPDVHTHWQLKHGVTTDRCQCGRFVPWAVLTSAAEWLVLVPLVKGNRRLQKGAALSS